MYFSTLASASAAATLLTLTQAANIDIIVGKNGLTFEPNSTTAADGDTLTFKFWPKSHSVVQGGFDSPCTPSDSGFNSDFVPVTSGAANETFVVTVNGTDPIWYYCSAGKHCQNGMVGVVNPPKSGQKTLKAYAEAAADVEKAETPDSVRGGVFESASSSSSGSSSSSTPAGSASSPASSTGAGASLQGAAGVAGVAAIVAGLWGL